MSELKVITFDDNAVGIMLEEGTALFTPSVAVEIAQSLIESAKEIDPTLDVEAICKRYTETRRPLDATLN